jgi:hypothetical protein
MKYSIVNLFTSEFPQGKNRLTYESSDFCGWYWTDLHPASPFPPILLTNNNGGNIYQSLLLQNFDRFMWNSPIPILPENTTFDR